MKTYDTFIPNFLEMQGKIERESFRFIADNCKIWHKGNCIADIDSFFEIEAAVNSFNGEIEVTFDNSEISEYIIDNFSFGDMWVFGKDCNGIDIYIKIALGEPNSNTICISFHTAEHPLKYAFKK